MAFRPICDTWMLTRPKAKLNGASYYGSFPSGFLERARALLGVTINDPVLHICSGMIRDYQSGPMRGKGLGRNDATVDLNDKLNPDFLLDVRTLGVNNGDVTPCWRKSEDPNAERQCIPFAHHNERDAEGAWDDPTRQPYAACLIDRPYTHADAAEYDVGVEVFPENLNDLLRRALSVTRVGGRVGVLDYFFPRPPRDGVRLIACIGVTVGWGNRMRCYSVFEREAVNPLEFNTTGERTEEDELREELPEPDVIDAETGAVLNESQVPAGTSVVLASAEDHTPTPKRPKKKRKVIKKKRRKKAAATRTRPTMMDGFGG